MTRDQIKAKLMANDTIKVRHQYFTPDEFIMSHLMEGTNELVLIDEQGLILEWNEFWRWRQGPEFADGWEIIKD